MLNDSTSCVGEKRSIHCIILAISFLLSHMMHQAVSLSAGQVQDTEDQ